MYICNRSGSCKSSIIFILLTCLVCINLYYLCFTCISFALPVLPLLYLYYHCFTCILPVSGQPIAMEMDELQKVFSRKGAKRKRLPFNEDLLERRKSARVRNTSRKKEQEVINYQDLLRKFLPSSLLYVYIINNNNNYSLI